MSLRLPSSRGLDNVDTLVSYPDMSQTTKRITTDDTYLSEKSCQYGVPAWKLRLVLNSPTLSNVLDFGQFKQRNRRHQ